MFKILMLFTLLSLSLFSKTVHFSEEKYHEAIDATFTKEGNITFLDKSVEVVYFDDKSRLFYSGERLTMERKGKKREVDIGKKPEIKMFFTLFRAIYFDDREELLSFFKIERFQGITTLIPLELVSNYIKRVEYKKIEEKLIFMEIWFASEDRVRIEELD